MSTEPIDVRELDFALRVLVHEARGALADLRPVIEGLLASDATPPPAGDAVARLDGIERVLRRVAAVYRQRSALRAQLEPAELEALLRAVYSLPDAGSAGETLPLPDSAEELEIALRVLVHEVGNALTSIKPLVDILHRNPGYLWKLPPEQRAASARVALDRLVDTAQVLAQIGDLRPRLAAVPVAGVVSAASAEMQPAADVAGVALRAACADGLHALADPLWLRHSLRNLVDNALRATPRGGRVAIDARPRGVRVELRVSDSGAGLSQDELEYIFHADLAARTRLRRPLAVNGAGIGLSLVRYWVHAMGGSITALSRRGVPASGTRVSIILRPPAEPVL